jgi:hypothetical protein
MFYEGAQSLSLQKAKDDTAGAETVIFGTATTWITDISAVIGSSSWRKRKDDFITQAVWAVGSVVLTRHKKQISFAPQQGHATLASKKPGFDEKGKREVRCCKRKSSWCSLMHC